MRFGAWNVGYIEVWVNEGCFKKAGEVQIGSGWANEVRWDKGGTDRVEYSTISYGQGNESHQLGQDFRA